MYSKGAAKENTAWLYPRAPWRSGQKGTLGFQYCQESQYEQMSRPTRRTHVAEFSIPTRGVCVVLCCVCVCVYECMFEYMAVQLQVIVAGV